MITYSRLDVTFYTIELIVLLFYTIFTVDPGYNEQRAFQHLERIVIHMGMESTLV